jgi:hypothetical protein
LKILIPIGLGQTYLPLLIFSNYGWPNTIKQSHTTETILPLYHFSIQLNKFSHPEGGGSMFLQNAKTFNHTWCRNPKIII